MSGSGNITVWINSPGGDCVAAAQIYNTPQDLSFERCVEDHVPFELLYENGCGSLEEDLERKEMLCILHKALQSIPAEEQEFIRELFFLHRTTRELAQKYGVSQPAIVKRKQRVLSTLKKYFENF